MWNPGMPTVLATATVTGEVTVWELKGDTLVKISSKPTFGASCLSWSSKVRFTFIYFCLIIGQLKIIMINCWQIFKFYKVMIM